MPKITLALFSALLLAGCAQPPKDFKPLLPENNHKKSGEASNISHNDVQSQALYVVQETKDFFNVRPVTDWVDDPLPDKHINKVTFVNASLIDVLRLLIADLPISLVVRNSAEGTSASYGSVVSYDLSGPLSSVVASLAKTSGFFYSFNAGILTITADKQFLVTLPIQIPEDALEGVLNTIIKLGANDAYLDKKGRSLVFRANSSAQMAIQGYLAHMREKMDKTLEIKQKLVLGNQSKNSVVDDGSFVQPKLLPTSGQNTSNDRGLDSALQRSIVTLSAVAGSNTNTKSTGTENSQHLLRQKEDSALKEKALQGEMAILRQSLADETQKTKQLAAKHAAERYAQEESIKKLKASQNSGRAFASVEDQRSVSITNSRQVSGEKMTALALRVQPPPTQTAGVAGYSLSIDSKVYLSPDLKKQSNTGAPTTLSAAKATLEDVVAAIAEKHNVAIKIRGNYRGVVINDISVADLDQPLDQLLDTISAQLPKNVSLFGADAPSGRY